MNCHGVKIIQNALSLLVIDADTIERQRLLSMLVDLDKHFYVESCDSIYSAEELVSQCRFDLWIMDIDLPGSSAFRFLEQQQQNAVNIPPVVFTTRHKEFALQAFDYPVFDYLIKPLAPARLAKCFQKYDQFTSGSAQHHPSVQPTSTTLRNDKQSIQFKNGCSWLKLAQDTILWIEAAGDYMCIHTTEDTHILRSTLTQLESQLADKRFYRISRSALVNWQHVIRCMPGKNGIYEIELSCHKILNVSRKCRVQLASLLEDPTDKRGKNTLNNIEAQRQLA